MTFKHAIAPYVSAEIEQARAAQASGHPETAFRHLENAHVLGQASTLLHTQVHCLMLLWGIKQHNTREIFGQCLRIIGALTKTAIGWIPTGNTGGSNISALKSLPLSAEHTAVLAKIKSHE